MLWKLVSQVETETKGRRTCYVILAVLAAVGFLAAVECYAVGATLGGDRNAYLLGGKMLAAGHARGIVPADPYVYLGPNWVMPKTGLFELKYPLGLPVLYAIVHCLAGAANWDSVAHHLSPLFAAAAVLGTFHLLRSIVGSFNAWLGMLLVATSPVNFYYANLPNSHSPALCAAVWGMVVLLQWWRLGGIWRAILAGLILGFNFTIRYSEGLLFLPLLLVFLFRTGGEKKAVAGSIALPAAWAVPVVMLLGFNLIVFGHANGYGLTNESTGFSWGYFLHNWRTMGEQLYSNTILFLLPMAVVGAILSLASNWRLSLVFWAWGGSTILAYTAYYWTPGADETEMRYVRFILTIVPAIALAVTWLLRECQRHFGRVGILGSGIVVAVSLVMNCHSATVHAAQLQWDDMVYGVQQEHVLAHVPMGSIIFADEPTLAGMDVAGDWRLYSSELFTPRYVRVHAVRDPDVPEMMQAQRADELNSLLGKKSARELAAIQNQLITAGIAEGRKTYVVLPRDGCQTFCTRYKLQSKLIDIWEIDGRKMQIVEVRPNADD